MELAGYAGGDPRAPLSPVTRDAADEIRDALAGLQSVRSVLSV
jgi:hypothetical protein